jgi:serine/threonine-protein kinase
MEVPTKSVEKAGSTERPQIQDQRVGLLVGNYQLVRRIGEGGMGTVYEALHRETDNRIAVKFLRTDTEADGDADSAAILRHRFHDEASALADARHPNLVTYFDSGHLPDGQLYIMMEFLDGKTLREFVEEQGGKLPVPLASEFVRQTASALAYIHSRGIVHRDLNLRNLMVVKDGTARQGWRIKILDFGIAKFLHHQESRTRSQSQLGTVRYMSPEQCEAAKSVDASTDIYSLGLILFELLTGQLPYQVAEDSAAKWIDAHVNRPPRSLKALWTDAPPKLARLVAEMLDKHPDYRPKADEIEAHLESGCKLPQRRGFASQNQTLAFLLASVLIPNTGTVGYELLSRYRKLDDDPSAAQLAVWKNNAPSGTVLIPPTSLFMGSYDAEIEAAQSDCLQKNPKEKCNPASSLRESQPQLVSTGAFYLDETEVTNELFLSTLNSMQETIDLNPIKGKPPRQIRLVEVDGKRTMMFDLWNENGKGSGLELVDGQLRVRRGFERLPMVLVTKMAAERICQKRGGRLPSEIEWEAAARGRERRLYPWGASPPSCDGVAHDRVPDGTCKHLQPLAVAVRSSPQDVTKDGVFDLGGNVMEWVRDSFMNPFPRCGASCRGFVAGGGSADINPTAASSLRGGSYATSRSVSRGASRSTAVAQQMTPNLGFRCVFPIASK